MFLKHGAKNLNEIELVAPTGPACFRLAVPIRGSARVA